MRAVAVAPVNESHFAGSSAKLLRPIESRVASANDYDLLSAEFGRIADAVMNATAVPLLGTGLGKTPRRKGADAGGDDDGPRRKAVGLRHEDQMIVFSLQPRHVLIQECRKLELRGLLRERLDQVLRENLRVARYIEDVLLGVQRRQLAAELRESVHDLGGRPAHSGIKKSEEPCGSSADDRDVF